MTDKKNLHFFEVLKSKNNPDLRQNDNTAQKQENLDNLEEKTITFSLTQIAFYIIIVIVSLVIIYIVGYNSGKKKADKQTNVEEVKR